MDTPPSERYPIYTRANAGEVMPDPMSPLTGSLGMMNAGEAGWRDAYVRFGSFDREEFETDRPNCIGCFGGYLYLNMSMTRIYGVRCPGLTPEMVDFQYFGTMPGIPPYTPRPGDENPDSTARLQAWLNEIFVTSDLPELRDQAAEIDRVIAARPDLPSVPAQELVARARSLVPRYRDLFNEHIGTSGASGVGIGTVAGVCQAIGRPELTMQLIAGAGDVDSAAPSWALWDLSRIVASSTHLTELFATRAIGDVAATLRVDDHPNAASFRKSFDTFLQRFGARGPNEWEMRSHTWGTKPALALAAVDRMRLAPDTNSPAQKAKQLQADREAAVAQVEAALAGDDAALAQFRAGLQASLVYLPGRERTKTNSIKIVHEMRLALRELGRRAVEAGAFDHVEQVFMLTDDELDACAADPHQFSATVRDREDSYLALFDLEPPFVITSDVPPLDRWPKRSAPHATKATPGTVLSGIAGCAGKATGRARVILDPGDPTALEPGDVLVAPVTDPAWTPLFVPAAAVVVDVGAQITHAVIVSRELGIPCVVSVTDATHLIPDGATVTVDGTAGTVTIH